MLTDTDPYYRETLQHQFAGPHEVVVESIPCRTHSAGDRFRHYDLDTVVALNVIEHIDEDVEATQFHGRHDATGWARRGPGSRAARDYLGRSIESSDISADIPARVSATPERTPGSRSSGHSILTWSARSAGGSTPACERSPRIPTSAATNFDPARTSSPARGSRATPFWSVRHRHRSRRVTNPIRLSVLIAAYNEERTITAWSTGYAPYPSTSRSSP